MKTVARLLMVLTLALLGQGVVFAALGDPIPPNEYLNPDPQVSDHFGFSIAPFDNRIVVGAPRLYTALEGAAYVLDATTGHEVFRWHGEAPQDLFGYSVAAVGNTVAIGSPYLNGGVGAAYLYNGLTGDFISKIPNPQPNPGDTFGSHVAPYGNDKLLIAAERDNTRGLPQEGAVYLYDLTGQRLHMFLPPTPTPEIDFGKWVAAVGDKVLIGAQRDGGDGAGAAYLFDADGNFLHKFVGPGPYFGHSVDALGCDVLVASLSSTTLFEGAPPWSVLHEFPTGGDIRAIGESVLIRPDAGTTLTLYNGHHPYNGHDPYDELHTFGMASNGPGMAALGNDILVGANFDGNFTGRVYLRQGIPEPSTLALLAAGAIGLAACAWRRRKGMV
jgi:hypothetical protein